MSATSAGRRKRGRGRTVPGLEDEIRLLREIIQRAAGRAAGQLSGLLKTERALGALRAANDELDLALREALDELDAYRREHGVEME